MAEQATAAVTTVDADELKSKDKNHVNEGTRSTVAAADCVAPSGVNSETSRAPSGESARGSGVRVSTNEDAYERAVTYLAKHGIGQLFQHLTADILYKKPTNVVDFMVEEVQSAKELQKQTKNTDNGRERTD